MVTVVKVTSLTKILAAGVAAVSLAGCSSLPTGPLALSDSGTTVAHVSAVPRILPARKPGEQTSDGARRDIVLRGTFGSNVHALTSGAEPAPKPSFENVNDPLEPLNRVFHQINRGVDFAVMRPVTFVYNKVLPRPVRGAVKNGLRHIALPAQVVNYTLQGEGEQAGNTVARFLVNSIVGFGGLADPARLREELKYRPTDFGITLGKWGVGEGFYYETPLIGPTTTRASFGRIVDIALSPLTYITFATDLGSFQAVDAIGPSIRVLEVVEKRARNADLVDEILYASPDTYVTLRTVYLQNVRSKVSGGEVTASNLPEILEFTAQ